VITLTRIDVANQNIEANRQASIATLADHDTRITSNTSALTPKSINRYLLMTKPVRMLR
jgi:hypothetical protein